MIHACSNEHAEEIDKAKKVSDMKKKDPFSLGKKCGICGGPVLNQSKVLTCQSCRAKQAEAKSK
jgi:hypothetical protein